MTRALTKKKRQEEDKNVGRATKEGTDKCTDGGKKKQLLQWRQKASFIFFLPVSFSGASKIVSIAAVSAAV